MTGSADVGADLTAALTAIRLEQMSCDLDMPNAANVDLSTVIVKHYTGNGNQSVDPNGPDATCPTGEEFYYAPNETNPTTVVLCPDVCNSVRGDPDQSIEYTGECVGGYLAYQEVFDYEADCTAANTTPQWNFLSYDTTIPDDATVVWEMSTSNVDAATAAAGPYTVVSTATALAPDVLPSSPVVLYQVLGGGAVAKYLSLWIKLNMPSIGTGTLEVHDWNLQFSCDATN